jgi:hypothetical protein
MVNRKKQKDLISILRKQMHTRLLSYHSKTTPSAGSNGEAKEKQMPLFYNKPIYKGKKHELL